MSYVAESILDRPDKHLRTRRGLFDMHVILLDHPVQVSGLYFSFRNNFFSGTNQLRFANKKVGKKLSFFIRLKVEV